jgi:hypothetical protein
LPLLCHFRPVAKRYRFWSACLMNSKERVTAVFQHEIPDRVPCWCGSSEEFWEKAKSQLGLGDEELRVRFHDDFRRVFARYNGPSLQQETGAGSSIFSGLSGRGTGTGRRSVIRLQMLHLRRFANTPGLIRRGWMFRRSDPRRSGTTGNMPYSEGTGLLSGTMCWSFLGWKTC